MSWKRKYFNFPSHNSRGSKTDLIKWRSLHKDGRPPPSSSVSQTTSDRQDLCVVRKKHRRGKEADHKDLLQMLQIVSHFALSCQKSLCVSVHSTSFRTDRGCNKRNHFCNTNINCFCNAHYFNINVHSCNQHLYIAFVKDTMYSNDCNNKSFYILGFDNVGAPLLCSNLEQAKGIISPATFRLSVCVIILFPTE